MATINTPSYDDALSWLTGLQYFLYEQILPLAEPDPIKRVNMVDQNSMNVWEIAFTHESFNPNVGRNYEELERLGDAVMKNVFIRYLMTRFPNIARDTISELVNYYMSKAALSPIAVKLGLNNWIRSAFDSSTHEFEDLFESLFGALSIVGDQVFQRGAGYTLSYNLLENIYNDIDIDLSVAKGHPKTQVKQIFEKMGWGTVLENWRENVQGISGLMTLEFTPQALRDLTQRGIPLPAVISSSEGSTKKVAGDNAYSQALTYLQSRGITQEWADAQRGRREFNNPELSPYYPNAISRLRSEGFSDMYFKTPKIRTGGCNVQLIGVRPDRSLEVLASITECSPLSGKREALRLYASGEV